MRSLDRRITVFDKPVARKSTVSPAPKPVLKMASHLKTFHEFADKRLNLQLPFEHQALSDAMSQYFSRAVSVFYQKLQVLRDYDSESAMFEQILSSFIAKAVPKMFVRIHVDVLVTDNKLTGIPDGKRMKKVQDIFEYISSLDDVGLEWEFLKSWFTVADTADTIVFEMKTKHYDRLTEVVAVEFDKYKKKYI